MVKTEVQDGVNVAHVISTLAYQRRWQPVYVVHGDQNNRFYAAKWKLPPHRVTNGCMIDHMLICRTEGSTTVSKIIDGKTTRKHMHPGIVTFIPSGERAQYIVEDQSTYLELYISPSLLRRFCEQHVKSGHACIQPLFGVDDSWLAGYFQMLASEIEMYGDSKRQLDPLFLAQAQQLLLGHLVRVYSDSSPTGVTDLERRRVGPALRPHLLKLATDFIRGNLGADICLPELARLVDLSEAHFIRAFYAATGTTPYQYVLDERLRASAESLRANRELSIAEVAMSTGFKSQSHFANKFKARYGMTPSQYRNAADA